MVLFGHLFGNQQDMEGVMQRSDMERCPQCGHMNPIGSARCQECEIDLSYAQTLERACPACGAMNAVGNTNCSNCGVNLEKAMQRAGPAGAYDLTGAKRQAANSATWALVGAIAGFFICPIVFFPVAISQARKAKAALAPGDPGHGRAVAAEVIAWIGIVIWVLIIIIQLCTIFSDGGGYGY
jgi:ribosomal protein L40E